MKGQVIGNYRLGELLGEGAQGTVYRAHHKDTLGMVRAIKLLSAQVSRDRKTVERFFKEAVLADRVKHPGIRPIYDHGYHDEYAYMMMELLEGSSLAGVLKREKRLQVATALDYTWQVANAMHAAHVGKVIHRDLKPDNLFVVSDATAQKDRVLILDFGISKLLDVSNRSVTAAAMGTPAYMPPEQFLDPMGADERSDIYALGCVLFHMLIGEPPFPGKTITACADQHRHEQPRSIHSLDSSIPLEVDALVTRMMAKQPADRPQSMMDVAGELATLQGMERMTTVTSGEQRSTIALNRRAWAATLAGAGILALAVGAFSILTSPEDGQDGHASAPAGLVGASHVPPVPPPDPPAAPPPRVPQHPPTPVPRKPPPPTPPDHMVYLPGGTFSMGSKEEDIQAAFEYCKTVGTDCRRDVYEREQPVRKVKLSPFFLDKDEVTNAQFAEWLGSQKFRVEKGRFVRDGKTLIADLHPGLGRIDYHAARFTTRDGAGDHPVVQVTWIAANRYCQEHGKKLPSEAQWEFAARGQRDRRFPWGADEPTCDGVNQGRGSGSKCAQAGTGTAPVGASRQDGTPEGVMDLGGNVAEWVTDRFVDKYPACDGVCSDPVFEGEVDKANGPAQRVVRGGAWDLSADAGRGAGRSPSAEDQVQGNVGFRCAQPVEKK